MSRRDDSTRIRDGLCLRAPDPGPSRALRGVEAKPSVAWSREGRAVPRSFQHLRERCGLLLGYADEAGASGALHAPGRRRSEPSASFARDDGGVPSVVQAIAQELDQNLAAHRVEDDLVSVVRMNRLSQQSGVKQVSGPRRRDRAPRRVPTEVPRGVEALDGRRPRGPLAGRHVLDASPSRRPRRSVRLTRPAGNPKRPGSLELPGRGASAARIRRPQGLASGSLGASWVLETGVRASPSRREVAPAGHTCRHITARCHGPRVGLFVIATGIVTPEGPAVLHPIYLHA